MEKIQDFLDVLGLDETADARAIRRAYARRLKLIDQASDADVFQSLRAAYEAALAWIDDRSEKLVSASPPASACTATSLPPAASDREAQGAAAAMFARFQETTLDFAAYGRREDLDAWREALYSCLDDEMLFNIQARFGFEERIVHYLCDGWRPGNETLFVAAIAVFAWDAERRGLQAFGPAGALLSQAIDEQTIFEQQAIGVRGLKARLVMRLRWEDVPDEAELRYNQTEFFGLVYGFPALMHVTANEVNLQRWLRAYESLPADVFDRASETSHWMNEVLPALVMVLVLLIWVALNI